MLEQRSEFTETHIKRQQEPIPSTRFLSNQQDSIYIGVKGVPAFRTYQRPFYLLLPMCLWLALKQPHILYYIIQTIFQYFKGCQPTRYGDIVSTAVLFFLVLICIFFEVHARYRTYLTFTGGLRADDRGVYRTWNFNEKQWEQTETINLREGQIIFVERYLQTNPKLNPTNMLPLAYASCKRNIQIKTTGIDKREEFRKIELLPCFRELIQIDSNNPPTLKLDPSISDIKIDYSFISDLGGTFEAELISNDFKRIVVNNEDMIPAGIKISTEDFVVGVIIREMRGNEEQNLQRALLKQNNISRVLNGYLKATLIVNFLILLVYFVTILIVSEVTTDIGTGVGEFIYCLVLSFIPFFMNTVYISMHILIYIFRMMGKISLGKDLKLNHQTKSVDQLAQTDTLIMDDFFFFLNQKPFNPEDVQIAFNKDAPLSENVHLMLKVIQLATSLQQNMSGHTIPIAKYFRLNPQLVTHNKKSKVRILKETPINDGCVNVKIKVIDHDNTEKYFAVKFNDAPVLSTIAKLPNDLKRKIESMQYDWQQHHSLLFFIEIVELSDLTASSQLYELYAMLTFTLDYDYKFVNMLKEPQVQERFNVILLTNKTQKYISYFLKKSGMYQSKDSQILLEDKEEGKVNQNFKDQRKTLKTRQTKQQGKSAILFLNSTMITYLSRKSIRQSLFKLAPYCKYIVFFNCSQFQKQICAVNLFKIFPQHLLLSNYLCDRAIFHWANLSICQREASSASLTTFVVRKYEYLPRIVLSEAVLSLQIIQSITSAHIFKNMFFLGAVLLSYILVFQGGSVILMQPYLEQLFFFYNFIFTLAPHIYQLIKRPQVFPQADILRYVDYLQMVSLSIKAWIFGVVVAFLGFSLLQGEFVTNLFTLALVTSVVTGNMFVLAVGTSLSPLDNSRSKAGMVFIIILQILFALVFILLIQLFQTNNFNFIMIGCNFDPINDWFYLGTFLVIPLFAILMLYAFSVGKQIWLILNHKKMMSLRQVVDNPPSASNLDPSQKDTEIVARVIQGPGRTISFNELIKE